jgi:hypothetical protein
VTTTGSGITFCLGGEGLTNETFTAGGSYTIPANGSQSGSGQAAFLEYFVTSASLQTPTVGVSASQASSLITSSFK